MKTILNYKGVVKMKVNIIKVKVGEIFSNGKKQDVFQTFWEKESAKGVKYFECRVVAFKSSIEKIEKEEIDMKKDE